MSVYYPHASKLKNIKQNGYVLHYVQNQTPEFCLTAVKQNGNALQYVKNKTFEICLAAVTQNKAALKYCNENFKKWYDREQKLKIYDSR
jgi:hypothetical protein